MMQPGLLSSECVSVPGAVCQLTMTGNRQQEHLQRQLQYLMQHALSTAQLVLDLPLFLQAVWQRMLCC